MLSEWISWAVTALIWVLLGMTLWQWVRHIRLLDRMGRLARFFGPRPALPLLSMAAVAGIAILSRVLLAVLSMALYPDQSLASMWSRWDAHHYLWIAENGYTADQSLGDGWLYIVFYPLFPWLTTLLGGSFAAAEAVSWLSLVGVCLLLHQWGAMEGRRQDGWWFAAFLLTFPVGVFLGLPYTESLFLLTSGGCLWALRRHRWLAAGLCGLAAALTRNLGLLLTVPYLVEWLLAHGLVGAGWRRSWRGNASLWSCRVRTALPGFLIFAGMGVYLAVNYVVYGDPLKFLEIQKMHWSQSLGTLTNTFRYTWNGALAGDAWSYYLWIPQLLWMTGSLLALPAAMRKLRPAEGAYTAAYVIAAMSPTWLLSYPRYLMGMVTLYPLLAKLLPKRWMRVLWCVVMGVWMVFQALAFARGAPVL